nr:SUMO-specific isopeptidase USPL1-like isoform X5 [Salvelinus alpinus]
MSCEGTGLGALGPLAGYWEKIQERSASLETCPWCAAKGQTQALRSYRISIQEVITLCTDPQCLFPLVSRPLEDVLASLVPPLPQTGRKRKSPSVLENGYSVPSPKSARSEEAVAQNESRPVVRITSTKLNGEDCFNKTKHTTPVQKERISRSEPTDVEPVDKTLNYPLPETERGGANGYHKDSDWPIPEEMDQEVLDEDEEGEDGDFLPEEGTPTLDKGLPLPEKTVPTSQLAVSFVDAESAPKEVICPLDKAVFALEKTLSVSRVAVSTPEKILPPLHLAVSASKKNVAALEKGLATRVTVPNLQDTVRLLEALIAPGEAVSLPEEALPVPGEAVSTTETILVLQEALTVLEEASPGMKESLSVLQKEKEEDEVLISLEKEEDEVLISLEDEVLISLEKEEDEVLISLEEEDVATLVALEAVSIPAVIEVVPALEKDEEDLPVFDEEEKIQEEECPLQEVCRPCSVDLSQSKVSEGHVAGDDEDDGPIRAKRRAHNARQLSDEEQEVSVKEDVEVLTPPPKKKRGRPRKTHIIKYTQEVLPDFDPEVISTGELVPVPGPHLFWKNEHSLGWLDTLLVALVHCRTLRDRRPIKRPTVGQPVWDLCERYDRACSLSTAYQHTGADGVVRVPSAVLQRLQTEMQAIRTRPSLNCWNLD